MRRANAFPVVWRHLADFGRHFEPSWIPNAGPKIVMSGVTLGTIEKMVSGTIPEKHKIVIEPRPKFITCFYDPHDGQVEFMTFSITVFF